MARETAQEARGTTQDQGQPSQGEPQAQPAGEPQAQPSQPGTAYQYEPQQPGVNDENYRQDPAWKKAQAGYQKQINALQGQLQQIQAEAEKQRMAGMSETEQLQYAADQWRQEAMKQAQYAQTIEAEHRRNEDLSVIQQATGVPAQQIAGYLESVGSNSAHDAWAWAWAQGQRAKGQDPGFQPPQPQAPGATSQFQDARFQQPQGPPRVDVGGGAAPNAASAIQQKYDEGRKNFDMAAMMGAMREADDAGVEIKEW